MNILLIFLILSKYIYCEYSSIDFHEDLVKESGNYWITANNICITRKESENWGRLIMSIKEMNDFTYIIGKMHNYLWKFHFDPNFLIGNPSYEYINEDIWLISSHHNHNIAHFLDNMFLYNIQNDNKYPPMNHLIMADFNPQSTIPYNNMMLKMMINNYNKPFKISFQSEISKLLRKSKNHLLCYKTVHIYIRSENGGWLGIFRNYHKGRQYRDEGYKYIKIKRENIKENENLITIVNRIIYGNKRNIINLEMIKEMIKSMKYNYNEIYFENKSPKEQIESIMKSKIIISPHGSGLTNMIWILSSKCLIIECMTTFLSYGFERLSSSLNYNYILLHSMFNNINPNTFDEGYDKKYKFESKPTIYESVYSGLSYPTHKTGDSNMTMSLKQMKFSLNYGLNYLNVKDVININKVV